MRTGIKWGADLGRNKRDPRVQAVESLSERREIRRLHTGPSIRVLWVCDADCSLR